VKQNLQLPGIFKVSFPNARFFVGKMSASNGEKAAKCPIPSLKLTAKAPKKWMFGIQLSYWG